MAEPNAPKPAPVHDAPIVDQLDPAQQSLADALQVSFNILKVIMLVLLVIYLFSGVFSVDEQQRAVKLRFGKILTVGDTGEKVLQPGGPYFAMPFPINDVIFVPMAPRTVVLRDEFWFEVPEGQQSATRAEIGMGKQGPLNPELDGSMVTGDANIVHTRWNVVYSVADPVLYVENIGSEDAADHLVRMAAEQGVVHAVAMMEADTLNKGQIGGAAGGTQRSVREVAMLTVQASLDAVRSGLQVDRIDLTDQAMPLSVRAAFDEVSNAESERGRVVDQAQQTRARILGETAGEAYGPLWDLVQAYELVLSRDEKEEAERLWNQLSDVFETLEVEGEVGGVAIGGQVSEVINDAKTYRAQVVERVRGEAETYQQLLPLWKENPGIVESRIWLTAKEQILANPDVETLYMPEGQLYLELNRDPRVERERERRRLEAEQMGMQGAR